MQTPVSEAVLCFLYQSFYLLLTQSVQSHPRNMQTIIWVFCLAQTSTDCSRSLNVTQGVLQLLCCQVFLTSKTQMLGVEMGTLQHEKSLQPQPT